MYTMPIESNVAMFGLMEKEFLESNGIESANTFEW